MIEKENNERPELDEKLAELEILRQSLDEAKAKEKDIYDQLLRLSAEYQNFRKRSETRIQESRRAGREDVLLAVISLYDALVQAEASSRGATDVETLKKGLTLVKEQVEKFLLDQGLVPIKSKGEKLDPRHHEAIAQIEKNDLEEGTVVDEIQRGYMLDGRVVRPARVSVAAKSREFVESKGPQEEKNNG